MFIETVHNTESYDLYQSKVDFSDELFFKVLLTK